MAEKERIGKASAKTLNIKGAWQLAGNPVTASAADLNTLTGHGIANPLAIPGMKQVAKVALVAIDTAGSCFSWVNPEASAIIISRLTIDVTTKSTGAGTLSVGTTAVSGTTSSANLIDTLDVGTAAGTFDNIEDPGTNGKPLKKLAAGAWVTGSKASGALAGLVGNAYIEYFLI